MLASIFIGFGIALLVVMVAWSQVRHLALARGTFLTYLGFPHRAWTERKIHEEVRNSATNQSSHEVGAQDQSNDFPASSAKPRFLIEESQASVGARSFDLLESILKESLWDDAFGNELAGVLSRSLEAPVVTVYMLDHVDDRELVLIGTAGIHRESVAHQVELGQGQLGQCAVDMAPVTVTQLPKKYLRIESGLGASSAAAIQIIPLVFKGKLQGAVECAFLFGSHVLAESDLEHISRSVGAHFFNARINQHQKMQFEQAQKQQSELQTLHDRQEKIRNELESNLRAVEWERAKNLAILEGCSDGVISFYHDGFIDYINPAACDMLQTNKEKAIGKSLHHWIPVQIKHTERGSQVVRMNDLVEVKSKTEVNASVAGEPVSWLITSTRVELNGRTLFTFFMQSISVDLF